MATGTDPGVGARKDSWFRNVVPTERTIRVMGLAILVNTIGSGLFMTISALYFTRVVGLEVAQVAAGLGIASAAGMFSGIPLGHLADRFGPREVQVLLIAGMGVLALTYLWVSSFWLFVVVATASRVLDRGVAAVAGALVAGVTSGGQRVAARAFGRSMLNLGLSIGAAGAAVALHGDSPDLYRAIIVIDAVSYLTAAGVYLLLPHVPPVPRASAASPWRALRDGPYVALTLTLAVLSFDTALLTFALPLWIVNHTEAPPVLVSVLFVLNTVGCVVLQVAAARRVETVPAAIRAARVAGVGLLATCALFAWTGVLPGPVAVVVLVAGGLLHLACELMSSSAQFCLAFELAPDDAQGQYQGLFSTGMALSGAVAPTAMALLPLALLEPGWLVLGAVFLAAGLVTGPAARRVARDRPVAAST